MSDEVKPARLRPLFLVKPDTMTRRDIRRAEKLSGFCIVECSDPEAARFLHPPPDAEVSVQAQAALSLMRYVSTETTNYAITFNGAMLIKRFVDVFLAASTPQPVTHAKPVKK